MIKNTSIVFLFSLLLLLSCVNKESRYISIPSRYKQINILIDSNKNNEALLELNALLPQTITEERFAYTYSVLEDMAFIYTRLGNTEKLLKCLLLKHMLFSCCNEGLPVVLFSGQYPDLNRLMSLIYERQDTSFSMNRSIEERYIRQFEFIDFNMGKINVPLYVDAFFKHNDSNIDDKSMIALRNIAVAFSDFNNDFIEVAFEGNTSSDEEEIIGHHRVMNVSSYFESINNEIELSVMNNGSKKPLRIEDSEDGKAYNRNVIIVVSINDVNAFIRYLGKVKL